MLERRWEGSHRDSVLRLSHLLVGAGGLSGCSALGFPTGNKQLCVSSPRLLTLWSAGLQIGIIKSLWFSNQRQGDKYFSLECN